MEENKSEPVAYPHRTDMERMLLVLGAAFIGTLNALVQTDEQSLRSGLAASSACFLAGFTFFTFTHALRIQEHYDRNPKTFNVLITFSAVAGVSGVVLLLKTLFVEALKSGALG